MTSQPIIFERWIVIDGIVTRTLEVDGDGPVILLLHGFTDSADTWRPVLAELASMRRRAVAVDLPGHGWASPLERPVFSRLDQFADGLVTRYGEGRPVVIAGNSLGGTVALRAATRGLPLAAVAGLGPGGLAHTRRLERIALWARRLDPVLRLFDLLPVPRNVVKLAASRVHRHLTEGAGDESLTASYASHIDSMREVARLRADLLALAKAVSAEPVRVDEIRVPVLLIWGERDRLADITGAPLLLDAVPDSRLVVVDAGHCPQVQLPTEVAALLAELPINGPNP
jgi:pimeloyl-ACP methyl ester carboxylesterase